MVKKELGVRTALLHSDLSDKATIGLWDEWQVWGAPITRTPPPPLPQEDARPPSPSLCTLSSP